MSLAQVKRFEAYLAEQGRPVRRPLSLRAQAARLRARAAEDLAAAAELEQAADLADEPAIAPHRCRDPRRCTACLNGFPRGK